MFAGLKSFGSMILWVCGLVALASPAAAKQAAPSKPPKMMIAMERTRCFGSCPVYQVTITETGRVTFTAPAGSGHSEYGRQPFAQTDGVLLPGVHEDRIPKKTATRLFEQFRAIRLPQGETTFRTNIPDLPSTIIILRVGDTQMQIVDHGGSAVGMPQSVTDLQKAIDAAAGTDRWIDGTPGLVAWLKRSGFDFRSHEAAELAVAAALGDGAEATIAGLVLHGAPLDAFVMPSSSWRPFEANEPRPAGLFLMEKAIERGHADVFRQLVAKGWLDRTGKERAAQIFAGAGAGCSPALVDSAMQAGIPVDTRATEENRQTALARLHYSRVCRPASDDRVKTAERLLANGANPNSRDALGRTPLFGAHDFALLNLLLQRGADARAKSNNGESMIFGSWSDAVIARLLEAGASPDGRFSDGSTLTERVQREAMPLTARWLEMHPDAASN